MKSLALSLIVLSLPPLAALANPRIVMPAGAPPIASGFRSMMGVDGLRRPARHQGIDIKGPDGQPVIAIADGVVLETDIGDCWGPTVVIDHGRDLTGKPLIAAYGHVEHFAVKPGQKVRRGQLIARLGNNQRGHRCMAGVRHLHLQLGRKARGANKGSYWGHLRYLADGRRGVDPHPLWAGGKGFVTCFEPGQAYRSGTITYPVPCN